MKRFIVRKYVMAKNASQALRKEASITPDDVYLDDEWVKQQTSQNKIVEGFKR